MKYISTAEASQKWGISSRQVQRLLAGNRIPDAQKYGRSWMIPADIPKPADPRRDKELSAYSLSADLSRIFAATTMPMPANNPDGILNIVREDRLRNVYEGELAYLRGDFARTMACYGKTQGDEAARLRMCPAAIAAAISRGDYAVYTELESYLKNYLKSHPGSNIAAVAELSLGTAAVSVIAPNLAPEWLKAGDLDNLPSAARLNAIYLRAKYFNCLGRFEAMLAVAQTALSLSSSPQTITIYDIYLRLMCAVACHYLERPREASGYLLEAMGIALPHGLITPFAEIVTTLGGLMERCLEQEFPDYYDPVLQQWQHTWKNWISFHNQFTKDNITLILSLREYHIAVLAARRVPYAQIARQHYISVGRLKNIMLEIYGKLFISGRDELAKYVL